jgi:hypothetical protein
MSHHTGFRLSGALVNGKGIHPEVVILHQFSKLRGYEKSFMRGGQHLPSNSTPDMGYGDISCIVQVLGFQTQASRSVETAQVDDSHSAKWSTMSILACAVFVETHVDLQKTDSKTC